MYSGIFRCRGCRDCLFARLQRGLSPLLHAFAPNLDDDPRPCRQILAAARRRARAGPRGRRGAGCRSDRLRCRQPDQCVRRDRPGVRGRSTPAPRSASISPHPTRCCSRSPKGHRSTCSPRPTRIRWTAPRPRGCSSAGIAARLRRQPAGADHAARQPGHVEDAGRPAAARHPADRARQPGQRAGRALRQGRADRRAAVDRTRDEIRAGAVGPPGARLRRARRGRRRVRLRDRRRGAEGQGPRRVRGADRDRRSPTRSRRSPAARTAPRPSSSSTTCGRRRLRRSSRVTGSRRRGRRSEWSRHGSRWRCR